jgi:hypothetical protein
VFKEARGTGTSPLTRPTAKEARGQRALEDGLSDSFPIKNRMEARDSRKRLGCGFRYMSRCDHRSKICNSRIFQQRLARNLLPRGRVCHLAGSNEGRCDPSKELRRLIAFRLLGTHVMQIKFAFHNAPPVLEKTDELWVQIYTSIVIISMNETYLG